LRRVEHRWVATKAREPLFKSREDARIGIVKPPVQTLTGSVDNRPQAQTYTEVEPAKDRANLIPTVSDSTSKNFRRSTFAAARE
jgi:hypothetical protein